MKGWNVSAAHLQFMTGRLSQLLLWFLSNKQWNCRNLQHTQKITDQEHQHRAHLMPLQPAWPWHSWEPSSTPEIHRVFIRSSKESLSMDIPLGVNNITINRIIFPPASPPNNKHWEKGCHLCWSQAPLSFYGFRYGKIQVRPEKSSKTKPIGFF